MAVFIQIEIVERPGQTKEVWRRAKILREWRFQMKILIWGYLSHETTKQTLKQILGQV